MKILIFVLMLFASSLVLAGNSNGKLAIGDKAVLSEIKMMDVSGKMISLNDVKQQNGVLVLFSCNTCPFVLAWEDRFPEIKEWADKNRVGMLVLNSNHQKRNGDDSFEAMKKHALDKNYNFYYALDEDSKLANAFGGQTTPHAFLFNADFKLAYKGAIDDNYESATAVKKAYLTDAITSLGNGSSVLVSETKPTGCSIKRKID